MNLRWKPEPRALRGSGAPGVREKKSESPRLVPLVQRLLRRIHLYLGLLVWPFVLLFAISGMSFNHPTIGRGLTMRRISSSEVERATEFRPWDAEKIALRVVEKLSAGGPAYRLSTAHGARFADFPLFAAPTEGGRQVVIVRLSEGSTTITERPMEPEDPELPFGKDVIRLEEYDLAEVARRLNPLLAEQGIATMGPLRPHPEVHPEVRFVMLDAEGRAWNTVYDLSSGTLSGKPADAPAPGAFVELLEAIHTQHHYPPETGPTFWWALFADVTAVTLIVWALTGLLMWWQLKRLRRAGAVVVAFAVVLAGVVMVSTAREIRFAPGAEEH